MVKKIVFPLFLLFLSACQPQNYKNKFVISGTYLEIVSPRKEAASIVFNEFKRLDKIFNSYRADSEISKVNNSYNIPIKVSNELIEVINLSKDVYDMAKNFATSVGKGEVEVKHSEEPIKKTSSNY